MSLREPNLVEALGATQEGLLLAEIDAEEWRGEKGGRGGDRGGGDAGAAAAERL
jgi:hypothetical protein